MRDLIRSLWDHIEFALYEIGNLRWQHPRNALWRKAFFVFVRINVTMALWRIEPSFK